MRIAAIIIGAVLVLTAVNWTKADGTPAGSQLWPLLKADFEPGASNKGNFFAYFAAILAIGALGYVPQLKTVSTLLLAIVVAVLLMSAVKKNPNLLNQAASIVQQKAS